MRALTGKDTDRLPEEQARGISIDLGYAPLDLPDGRRLSLIDVPGHERFVRNMVAGATGIDLFLLVVDAGEGARPQTHEHLAILRLLGIERGVVAVTKADAVDAETLELALEEARELVPDAEVVAVSAKTGAGLDELRAALGRAADLVAQSHYFRRRRPVCTSTASSRCAGSGPSSTGTLWSGTIGEGDVLRAEPAGREVRVRSVQVHDQPVERAEAGQRVALALPGVERSELRRGDVLIAPGSLRPSFRLDVTLDELEPIADGERLLVHHGTSAVLARVTRAGGYAQLRLAAPVVAARGDRIVLRGGTTVGGGTVIDPVPAAPRRPEALRACRRREQTDSRAGPRRRASGVTPTSGSQSFAPSSTARWTTADPLDPGVDAPTEPWAHGRARSASVRAAGLEALPRGQGAEPGRPGARGRGARSRARGRRRPRRSRSRTPSLRASSSARASSCGSATATRSQPPAYERARALVVEECESAGRIALARFRDLAGCGRRDAQLVLERLDADGVTRRVRDERLLRRRPSEPAT